MKYSYRSYSRNTYGVPASFDTPCIKYKADIRAQSFGMGQKLATRDDSRGVLDKGTERL